MTDPYRDLALALSDAGIQCQFQSAGQMIISQQVGSVWPNRGNSFWVTRVGGCWYLFTWVPAGYRVPESSDIAALCRTCMDLGNSAMYRVPSEIVNAFSLVELSVDEGEAIFEEMDDSV